MRKLIVFGVPVKVHPTLPLMLALALWLDEKPYIFMTCIFLMLHEAAHVAVAKRMNLRVVELVLMPLGGSARVENLWLLRPSQIVKIALAGPILNLSLALILAATGFLFGLDGEGLHNAIRINGVLCAFNLLPALPLDGGRVLCGLLSGKISVDSAVRVGTRLSFMLAFTAILAAGVLFFCGEKLNLTLIACGLYLMATAPQERYDAASASLISMMDRSGELSREGALPLQWIAVSLDAQLYQAARKMRPGKFHRFAVYRDMSLVSTVEESAFKRALISRPDSTFESFLVHSSK